MSKRSQRLPCALLAAGMLAALLMAACSASEQGAAAGASSAPPSAAAAGTDLPAGAWYTEAAQFCLDRGLLENLSDGRFAPDVPADRATLVTALYRAAGSPVGAAEAGFSDVPADAPELAAVSWAAAGGVVNGYPDGRFGGSDPVTREQLAVILWRQAGRPAAPDAEPFADQSAIGGYAVSAVAWARAAGIVQGRGGNRFEPKASISRGEVAVMLQRWLNLSGSTAAQQEGEKDVFYLSVNGETLTADFADNSSAEAFRALLSAGPVTVSMDDYGGFEKVGSLGCTLPRNDTQLTVTPGDVILYQGSSITVYYGENRWSFTRLGKVRDQTEEELRTILGAGAGAVDITFSLAGGE